MKILQQISGGGYNNSETSATSPIYDDGTNFGSTDVTVTPNTYYSITGMFESHGSALTDRPGLVSRSLDGSYSRFEFQNSSSTRLGYLEQDSSQVRFSVPTAGVLSYTTTDRIKWNSTGLGFFNVTPVAQQGATTDLGVALSNLGLRTAGTAYPITTSGATTLTGIISTGMDTMAYAGTISLSVTAQQLHKTTTVNATGNATINASAAGSAGQRITVLIVNDATTGKVITFGTNFKPNGTLTGTVSKGAIVEFVSDGTNWWETSRTLNL